MVTRRNRLAALAMMAALSCATVGAATAAGTAIDADPNFVVGYFKGFVSACRPEVHGDPDIGKLACSCAAAVIADRFTIDELKSLAGKGIDEYDKLHAGTSKLIGVCGAAAKAAVAK